jgi:hypothetical protein
MICDFCRAEFDLVGGQWASATPGVHAGGSAAPAEDGSTDQRETDQRR